MPILISVGILNRLHPPTSFWLGNRVDGVSGETVPLFFFFFFVIERLFAFMYIVHHTYFFLPPQTQYQTLLIQTLQGCSQTTVLFLAFNDLTQKLLHFRERSSLWTNSYHHAAASVRPSTPWSAHRGTVTHWPRDHVPPTRSLMMVCQADRNQHERSAELQELMLRPKHYIGFICD